MLDQIVFEREALFAGLQQPVDGVHDQGLIRITPRYLHAAEARSNDDHYGQPLMHLRIRLGRGGFRVADLIVAHDDRINDCLPGTAPQSQTRNLRQISRRPASQDQLGLTH